MAEGMRSPYPYFGCKSRIASLVWQRFGDVRNYVEPFFGSGAMLLARPGGASDIETINDACGYVSNFWRALQASPEEVARWADYPASENDKHARHVWLRERDMRAKLEGDPCWYDAQAAGWWVWGMALWIGAGWCGPGGAGPWVVQDGEMHRVDAGRGVMRQMLHLGNAGRGVMRKMLHLGNAGRGVMRKMLHSGNGRGVMRNQVQDGGLLEYMQALSERMRRVRVCCGDWSRITGSAVTVQHGLTAVFLDPPYSVADRVDCYAQESYTVAHDVRKWCAEVGHDPKMRIALCGYDTEHQELEALGWDVVEWKARGGMGNRSQGRGRANAKRERVWFSPACVRPSEDGGLFHV
jgi:site-specific DNA-adenine methylase